MLVIFKFEEEFYKNEGVNVKFVGYPRLELIKPEIPPQEFKKKLNLDQRPLIGIMPGSRKSEVQYLLTPILEGLKLIKKDFPQSKFILIKSQKVPQELIERRLEKFSELNVAIVENARYAAIKSCDFLIVCSGTSTIEVALLEKPFIIVYKLAHFSFLILKTLIKTPYIGMVNILLGKKVVPELIQREANPLNIYRYLKKFLSSPQEMQSIMEELRKIRPILKEENPSRKAAHYISELL